MKIMIKLTCSIFMFSNEFFMILFRYLTMFEDSLGKYDQNNKKRLQKKKKENKKRKVCESCQSLSKEEKEKNMVMNDTKIYRKIKNKNFLSIEK